MEDWMLGVIGVWGAAVLAALWEIRSQLQTLNRNVARTILRVYPPPEDD